MLGAAFVCAVITVALNDNYWQSDVIGSVGGVSFLLCLATYGHENARAHESDDAMHDETDRETSWTRGVFE